MRIYCGIALLILCGVTGAAAQTSALGDVTIRTDGNRILVLVDTIVDKTAAPDGLVDQWFTFETAAPPVPVFAHLPSALVLHSATTLRITTSDERYDFVLTADAADPFSIRGIGLAHNTGTLDGDADGACSSGGAGATSCSVTHGASTGSVACVTGYHACCGTSTNCRCVRN